MYRLRISAPCDGHRDRRIEPGQELVARLQDVRAVEQQDERDADDQGADEEGEGRRLCGARPAGTRHQDPHDVDAPGTGRDDRWRTGARSAASGRTAAILTGERASRAPESRVLDRDFHARAALAVRSCDHAADGWSSLVPSVAGGPRRGRRLAAGRVARRRPRTGPGRAADGDIAAPRLDVRAAADARPRRRGRLVAVGRPAGRSRPPGQPRPAPADGRLPGRDHRARLRARLGHRPLRHVAVLGPHGPARAADAGRGPAPRAGRPDHADPAAQLTRDAPPLGPAGPPFARRPVHGSPGHGVADVRGDDVGDPLLAAVQRVARGSAAPRLSSTSCS